MYLVDTSVWIDFLRKKETSSVNFLTHILDRLLPFGICGVVYQEILQGARSQQQFLTLSQYFSTQTFYEPQNLQTYEAAAQLYSSCRWSGITIRSTIDCLIAQIAIDHNLQLLHNDEDYRQIQSCAPSLQLVEM